MAKKIDKKPEKVEYKFPSYYGSHSSMIDVEKSKELNHPSQVVCKDEYGFYTTDMLYVDSGLADPNRYNNEVRKIW